MAKKLVTVEAIYEYVLVVDDDMSEMDIELKARDYNKIVLDDMGRFDADVTVKKISSGDQLPPGWDGRCIPYGGDCESTIDKILKS